MLKRPSTRRKTQPEPLILNLVPMLDALVTLIAFLMITMSFISMVSISSPVPMVSAEDNKKLLDKKPLQLTLEIKETSVRIKSLFNQVPAQTIENGPDGAPNLIAIHDILVGVKQKFPNERQIVVAPYGGLAYDSLIAIMDAVQQVEDADPPIFRQNPQTGIDEEEKFLFPDLVFGNLLGG